MGAYAIDAGVNCAGIVIVADNCNCYRGGIGFVVLILDGVGEGIYAAEVFIWCVGHRPIFRADGDRAVIRLGIANYVQIISIDVKIVSKHTRSRHG